MSAGCAGRGPAYGHTVLNVGRASSVLLFELLPGPCTAVDEDVGAGEVARRFTRAEGETSVVVSQGGPNLICSAKRDSSEWPKGDIDLRGTPW